jgi:ADP-ribose pyrophosphatase
MGVAHPQVGVGAVIVDDANRVLLMLRNKAPEAGHWSITGGRVEFMEPLERAIVREVKEELDVDVVVEELLCVTNHIVPADRAHWVAPAFLVRVINGQISNREPGSTRRIQFFPLDALPNNLTLTARNAINAYRARYGSRSARRGRRRPVCTQLVFELGRSLRRRDSPQ